MRILSGIQPSGTLHIGNYFGAMKRHVEQQAKGDAFYFIADLHALTTVQNAEALRSNVLNQSLDYLAVGFDPKKCTFYRQSDLTEVTELAWYLSCVTPMGLLERCHSYKDKVAKKLIASHGLFAYPVLMAADILIVRADVVPVGKDQKQHVEVTRDIALKFNNTFGETFPIPEVDIAKEVAVVPGIDGQKMSKSYDNTIGIFEDEGSIKKKVMSIKTDSKNLGESLDPKNCNVFDLYKLVASAADLKRMEADYRSGAIGYGDAKKRLLEALLSYFKPFKEQRAKLAKDPAYIEKVLKEGASKARATASKVMEDVRKKVGVK
ncbi:MAG: tryptophan--tRNA ligase [Candidatus Gracilibacteria bacterium]|nr:tryptophan--tRNA ligase [Candidatus Gracilibacteria bacterium]